MTQRIQLTFLALILAQAAHSIEEYSYRLYDVLAPARYLSGLVTTGRRVGFLVISVALVALGLWCYVVPVRRGVRAVAWAWAVVELANGVAHSVWALSAWAYRPGVAAAPLLLAAALGLMWQLPGADTAARQPRD
jgi:hypothetical protein